MNFNVLCVCVLEYNYYWYLGGNPTDFVTAIYNNHMFESGSGALYFSAVFASDANDYSCAVSVEGGDETRNSPRYPLVVDTSASKTLLCL